jgi:hypothetical protein
MLAGEILPRAIADAQAQMQVADVVVAIARALGLAPAGDEIEALLSGGGQPRQGLRIAAQGQGEAASMDHPRGDGG